MEVLTQAIAQFSSNPKVEQSSNVTQLPIFAAQASSAEEKSSLKVEESSSITESQIIDDSSPVMSTQEAADFLGWTEAKLSSRRKRGQPIEENGYKLTHEKQGSKVAWKAERLKNSEQS